MRTRTVGGGEPARVARRHGYRMAQKPQSFYVSDTDGPLLDGELDRAEQWGRELAEQLAAAV